MIKAGQKILWEDLQTLAVLANSKLTEGTPFIFFGAYRFIEHKAELTSISGMRIGDLAVTRLDGAHVGSGFTDVYQLTAYPSTTLANWQLIDWLTITGIKSSGARAAQANGPFPTMIDIQDYDYYAPDGPHTPIVPAALTPRGSSPRALQSHVIWRTPSNDHANYPQGWVPVGNWTDELNRLRHFIYRALTMRDPAITPVTNNTANEGLRSIARISTAQPVALPGYNFNPPQVLDFYSEETQGLQIKGPKIFYQANQPGTARFALYPLLIDSPAPGGSTQFSGGIVWLRADLRSGFSLVTSEPGRIKGTLFCRMGPLQIGVLNPQIYIGGNTELIVNANLFAGAGSSWVIRLDLDGPYTGGDIFFRASAKASPAPTFPDNGRFLPGPLPEVTNTRIATGTAGLPTLVRDETDAPNTGTPLPSFDVAAGDYGIPLVFVVDYASGPVQGIGSARIYEASLTVEALVPSLGYPASNVRAGENIARIRRGLVPEAGFNVINAVMVATTVPPGPVRLIDQNQTFAPADAGSASIPGQTATESYAVSVVAFPYPVSRDVESRPTISMSRISPVLLDSRLWTGIITEITISRMPDDAGVLKDPATLDALAFKIGAFGGPNGFDTFNPIWTGTLDAHKNSRTWRQQNPLDAFAIIPVLWNLPLAYQCAEPLLVQALFIPASAYPFIYSGVFPLTFSYAAGRQYVDVPILDTHYNDTETLLKLL